MNRFPRILPTSQYNFLSPAFWFGDVDARPLGLFRIAFAALMLKEAIYHIFVAEIWYSDSGMLPARLLPRLSPNASSFMSALPDTWMVIVIFVLWALVALLLLLGWQTRLMSILNLILLTAVINRNPLVVTGADNVMQVFAFWSIFLPLGRCYTLDTLRRSSHQAAVYVYAFPVRMFQVQIALIYIFSVIFKLQGQMWPSGDALYMAMQIRMHTFPLAEWLLTNAPTSALHVLTYMALLIEAAFPILVFAPIFQPYLRAIGLIAGVALHVGIGLIMNIPNFPLVMIIGYLVLLDPHWLAWLNNRQEGQVQAAAPQLAPAEVKAPSGCRAIVAGVPAAMGKGAYRGLLACLLLGIMFSIIWGNVLSNDLLAIRMHTPPMPRALEANLRATGLWQSWALFAPDPMRVEGWFGLNGIFANDSTYDLRSPLDRPHWYIGPEARWGKLEENLMNKEKDDGIFIAWAVYICRQMRGNGLRGLEIVLYSRPTSAPGQPFLPYQTRVIRGADCN